MAIEHSTFFWEPIYEEMADVGVDDGVPVLVLVNALANQLDPFHNCVLKFELAPVRSAEL